MSVSLQYLQITATCILHNRLDELPLLSSAQTTWPTLKGQVIAVLHSSAAEVSHSLLPRRP
jgi:hypothetical protein